MKDVTELEWNEFLSYYQADIISANNFMKSMIVELSKMSEQELDELIRSNGATEDIIDAAINLRALKLMGDQFADKVALDFSHKMCNSFEENNKKQEPSVKFKPVLTKPWDQNKLHRGKNHNKLSKRNKK